MRNGDERGGAFAFHGANNFGGVCGGLEDHGRAEQRRNEQCHKLSEDVTERDERDETERVKEAFVLAIRIDAALEGFKIGEEVAVGEDHAAGLGRGTGGEEDLRDVVASDGLIGERLVDGRRRLVEIVVSRYYNIWMAWRVG